MPRRLLRDGRIVADDWRTSGETAVPGDAELPGDGEVLGDGEVPDDASLIVTFAEWQAQRERLISRSGRLGVVLAPADEVERLVPDLPRLDLAGADFPGPSEGRGYTQGRLLRERFGFTGELRARGAIRRDQIFFLARCGFNSFELPEGELEGAAAALSTFSAAYQPSNDIGLAPKPAHR
jgi:uncharacterized protein (DUF934 family)